MTLPARIWLLLWLPVAALAQLRPMALEETRYEVAAGAPIALAAPSDTLDFLLKAASRSVSTAGLTAAPNRAGDQILLAASLLAKPGEYTATLSATSSTGEQRQTTLSLVVKPRQTVPSTATRPPVVLLNGWETGFTNACPVSSGSAETFGNLAQYLTSDGVPVVYFFDNCAEDANKTIETLGNDLGTFLNTITYDNGEQVQQIDLVAYSLGGLIARAYLAGLQPNESLTPPANTLVRDLVLIASPNFGSFLTANYASIIPTGTQSAELIPGSSFLWNLNTWNERVDDLRGVNAIAIVGNAGNYASNGTGTSLTNASDGIVSTTSASLGFVAQNNTVTRIVPYCHLDPGAFTNTSLGALNCSAPGIANITSAQHPSSQIIRSFLAGSTAWQSIGSTPAADPLLSIDGGTLFGMLNSTGSYVTDLTQVLWGTLFLQVGGDAGTIFFNDFVSGTGDFEATSQSLGTNDCHPVTEAVGYFAAARCKVDPAIISIGPLAKGSARLINAGAAITITGIDFNFLCNGCKVVATPTGTTAGVSLSVSSWAATSITAKLPSNLSGLVTISVDATTGSDSMTIMIAAAGTIAVAPVTLQFAASAGGSEPSAQSIQISNGGAGTLAWSATASTSSGGSWLSVSPASGTAPSTLSVSASIAGLSAGTYDGAVQVSATGASNTPVSVPVTLIVAAASPGGTISNVLSSASFQPGVASATWISVFGTNLSASTYTWQAGDFVDGQLPTSLQGVSVNVNGIPAYIEYVSPTQINALAPDDATIGPVPVVVITASQASNTFTAQKQRFAPAFFTYDSGVYAVAQHGDYSLVGPTGLLSGVTTTPAQPGEVIMIYGTGFGPTNPALPTGQLVTTSEPLANSVEITIGGLTAALSYAGLIESGVYQLNVTVPQGLPAGDAAVLATIGGIQTQAGVSINVAGASRPPPR